MKTHLFNTRNKVVPNQFISSNLFRGVFLMLLIGVVSTSTVHGQLIDRGPLKPSTNTAHGNDAIKWLTMEEAYKASKIIDKPLFIDVYTSWCGWCVRMDKTTFRDPIVASYINANFHPVKFNAETNDSIHFLERTYNNSQSIYVKKMLAQSDSTIKVISDSLKLLGSNEKYRSKVSLLSQRLQQETASKSQLAKQARRTTHDLAIEIMNRKLSYPTFVLLFDSLKNNFPIKGYQKPNQLLSVLSFFGEKVYTKTNDLGGYQKLFYSSFSSQGQPVRKFGDFNTTIKKAEVSKKKTLFLVTNDQLYSSQVFEKGSFNDPSVVAYLSEHFEVGKMNLYESDSLTFNGQVFKNVNGVHQLPISMMQNQVTFPSMIFLDENQKLIMSIPEFFLPSELLPILHFIELEKYKTGDYATFRKEYQRNLINAGKAGQ